VVHGGGAPGHGGWGRGLDERTENRVLASGAGGPGDAPWLLGGRSGDFEARSRGVRVDSTRALRLAEAAERRPARPPSRVTFSTR